MERITTGDWVSLVQGDTKSKWFVVSIPSENRIFVNHEDDMRSFSGQELDISMVYKTTPPEYK